MSQFLNRLLTEKFINEPNRKRTYEVWKQALGTPGLRTEGIYQGTETFDEQGNPVFSESPRYVDDVQKGTGLLADIYNPVNQARFASEMIQAPHGEEVARAMQLQIQRGGQVMDQLNADWKRQDRINNMTADALWSTIDAPMKSSSGVPTSPNVVPSNGLLPTPQGLVPAQKSSLRGDSIKPTGTADDWDIYSAQRSKIAQVGRFGNKDMVEQALAAHDAKWGYGPGAPNAIREWRMAQRFNGYAGSFEDWKKMTRQTIKETQPATVGDLEKLMFPPGSPGFVKYGSKSIPYGVSPEELAKLGAVTRDEFSGESAGKLAMLNTAQQQFPIIEETVFSEPGIMDNRTLWEMVALDFTDLASFGVSDRAQRAYAAFETGMQGITRTETGAAMRDEEIENTKRRFMPKPWSTNATNMLRWNAFQYFINNATDLIDPSSPDNRGLEPAQVMDKAVTKALKQFGVQSDDMQPPNELKPLFDKAKSEGITYNSHDDDYIYGIDSAGRKARVKR